MVKLNKTASCRLQLLRGIRTDASCLSQYWINVHLSLLYRDAVLLWVHESEFQRPDARDGGSRCQWEVRKRAYYNALKYLCSTFVEMCTLRSCSSHVHYYWWMMKAKKNQSVPAERLPFLESTFPPALPDYRSPKLPLWILWQFSRPVELEEVINSSKQPQQWPLMLIRLWSISVIRAAAAGSVIVCGLEHCFRCCS